MRPIKKTSVLFFFQSPHKKSVKEQMSVMTLRQTFHCRCCCTTTVLSLTYELLEGLLKADEKTFHSWSPYSRLLVEHPFLGKRILVKPRMMSYDNKDIILWFLLELSIHHINWNHFSVTYIFDMECGTSNTFICTTAAN